MPINTWTEFQAFMDACCTRIGADPGAAPHGRWWRTMSYQKFSTDGKVMGLRIVVPGDPNESNMIKALEGRPPFGADEQFDRMPPDGPFLPDEIAQIRDWIARGCPEV